MIVTSLSKDKRHKFSKTPCKELIFLTQLGVEGDAHCGETVKHRSRVKADPNQPNLRQVHLISQELLTSLTQQGFDVTPGDLGENVLTQGIDLLKIVKDTQLHLGQEVILRVTGLRNPCRQIEKFQAGLLKAVLEKDEAGNLTRKAGIMAVVEQGGQVRVGDAIKITWPAPPFQALERV